MTMLKEEHRNKMKKQWTRQDQALWECIMVALRAFRNIGWVTNKEDGKIRDILQGAMEREMTK